MIAISLFVLIALASANADYCSTASCRGAAHIGCNNSGAWASTCTSPTLFPRDDAYKSKLLASHNQIRNQVAQGKLVSTRVTFPSAARMQSVTWNDELSNLACLNVQTCKFAHDGCRATSQWPYAGQNLASFMTSSSTATASTVLDRATSGWIEEHKQVTSVGVVDSCCGSSSATGHFTVIIHERSSQIGCCTAKYQANGWWTYVTACNYAYTNMLQQRLYEKGSTASKCTTGTNPDYPGLCSTKEAF